MKLGTQFIYCSKKGSPSCSISINEKYSPVTVTIGNKDTDTQVHIFLNSIQDLINFKNSLLGSFNKAMREVKNA